MHLTFNQMVSGWIPVQPTSKSMTYEYLKKQLSDSISAKRRVSDTHNHDSTNSSFAYKSSRTLRTQALMH